MGVLDIQASLYRPTHLTMVRVVGIINRTPILRTENGKGRRRRNTEDPVEQGQIVLNRRTAEGVHDEDGLPGTVQRGWKVVSLPHKARPIADEPQPRPGPAVGQPIGKVHARIHLDVWHTLWVDKVTLRPHANRARQRRK